MTHSFRTSTSAAAERAGRSTAHRPDPSTTSTARRARTTSTALVIVEHTGGNSGGFLPIQPFRLRVVRERSARRRPERGNSPELP